MALEELIQKAGGLEQYLQTITHLDFDRRNALLRIANKLPKTEYEMAIRAIHQYGYQ